MGSLIAALVSFIVAVLVLLGANAKVQPDTFQGIAILAGAWFFALVLVVTPYRMWFAQRTAIALLNAQINATIVIPGQLALAEQKRRREKADGYRQLLERADALRDRPIAGAEEVVRLETDVDAWRDEVTEFIRVNDGHTAAARFAKSFSVDNPFYRPASFSSNHASKLQVLNVYRERVQELYDTAQDRLI